MRGSFPLVRQVAFFLPVRRLMRRVMRLRMPWRCPEWSPLESRGRGEAAGMSGLMKWGPRFAAQSVGLRRECATASHWVRQVAFFLPVRRVARHPRMAWIC